MEVSLTPKLDKFVASKVESGFYTSTSEVVREALRLLEEHDRSRNAQFLAYNLDLAKKLAELESLKYFEPERVKQRLLQKAKERRKTGK